MLDFLHKRLNASGLIEVIRYLFILLFLYAAISKLLDFETFQVQLAQSPLFSAYAGVIAVLVPGIEIVIAILLMLPRFRKLAFYASFTLMVMFTAYIYIILNFSDFIPCSCGGVLEKMSWTQHLIFNLVFILFAVVGIMLNRGKAGARPFAVRKTIISLTITLGLGVGLVSLLFLISEDIVHNRNNFTRRFPPHPVSIEGQLDLNLNSYYIAGIDENYIYLGNVTAPLHIRVLDAKLKTAEENEIALSNLDISFRSPTLMVVPPKFYFMDGYVPVIFSGTINNWKASVENKAQAFFSLIAPIDSISFAIRARDSKSNENILGFLKIGDSSSVVLTKDLLAKQIDGIFDTDGSLLYNKHVNRLVYIYLYRNQFIVMDTDLKLDFIGKTIDTISKARIKVKYVASEKVTKLVAPPLFVNKSAATYGNYLFVHSGIMGRFEPINTWKKSSVIDVYNLTNNTYEFSFYIQNQGNEQLTKFLVFKDRLVCLVGNSILVYKMDNELFDSSLVAG